jgi:hypothetical protein
MSLSQWVVFIRRLTFSTCSHKWKYTVTFTIISKGIILMKGTAQAHMESWLEGLWKSRSPLRSMNS